MATITQERYDKLSKVLEDAINAMPSAEEMILAGVQPRWGLTDKLAQVTGLISLYSFDYWDNRDRFTENYEPDDEYIPDKLHEYNRLPEKAQYLIAHEISTWAHTADLGDGVYESFRNLREEALYDVKLTDAQWRAVLDTDDVEAWFVANDITTFEVG